MIKRYATDGETFEKSNGAWVRYEDHASEVDRLSTDLHHARGEAERLRRYVEQFIEPVHAQREAAIYGVVYEAARHRGLTVMQASDVADRATKEWRAAQKGGDQ